MKEDYRSKRKIERKLFRKKKADKEKELFVQINSLAECKDTRKLYQRIKNVRNGYSQQPLLCKDESGSVLADEEKCLKRWTEYFRSLLNQSRPETLEEENAPEIQLNTQFVETPTLEEVRNNVQKLKNNKSPGSDNLPGELFKYGGEALCQRLHEIIVKMWEKEELPEEWELGIICPIYKKGDKLECDNYRGINLLNIAYKLFANILYNRLRPPRMKLLVNIKVDSATIARLQINYSVSGRCWKNAKNLMSKRTICSLISKQHMTESFESFYGA